MAARPTACPRAAAGALVQGRNDGTGELEWQKVTANHVRPDIPTLAIGIEDEREGSWLLTTTAEHPISVAGVGYVAAEHLEAGQWLVTESGAAARVVSVAATGSTATVYNLTVEGTENYFVGPSPVLVHNAGMCSRINVSHEGLHHTLEGHASPGNLKKSQFSLDPATLKNTLSSPEVVNSPLTQIGPDSFAREADLGRTVGQNSLNRGGADTSILTVITDRLGNLVTAFPGRR